MAYVRRPRGRRSRSPARSWRLRITVGAVTGLLVVAGAITVVLHGPGPSAAQGTPTGAQLAQLLPQSKALPTGWYLVHSNDSGSAYAQAGSVPPRPLPACYDFNEGFDLGVPGDTFVSSASETAQYGAGPGDGFLRVDLFGVKPSAGTAAIKAVRTSVERCSSYTTKEGPYTVPYTVTAAPVPGLGDESLAVHVTQQKPVGALSQITDNDTLVVRVGSSILVIECLAPPRSLITALDSIAGPIARKLPSATALPASRPATPGPAPAPSPGLTASQLERLLPVHTGLPAEYYQGQPLSASGRSSTGQYPLAQPPTALSCNQIPRLEGAGLTELDVNYRAVAYLDAYSPNSNALDAVIDEPSTVALADADFRALQAAAARCPALSYDSAGLVTTFTTVVTSVPGLGDESLNIRMVPATSNDPEEGTGGPQDILLVRAGGALVMVDYNLSTPGQAVPPVVTIAQALVRRL